jgi:hypothetical protein
VGDVIGAAFGEFADMLRGALTRPIPWTAALAVVLVAFLAASLRSKISKAWVWLPLIGGAIYFTVFRWLRLQ